MARVHTCRLADYLTEHAQDLTVLLLLLLYHPTGGLIVGGEVDAEPVAVDAWAAPTDDRPGTAWVFEIGTDDVANVHVPTGHLSGAVAAIRAVMRCEHTHQDNSP